MRSCKSYSFRSEKNSVSNRPEESNRPLLPLSFLLTFLLFPPPPLVPPSLPTHSLSVFLLCLCFFLLLCQHCVFPAKLLYIILSKIHHSILFKFINQGNSMVFQRWYHRLLHSVRSFINPYHKKFTYLFILKGPGMRKIQYVLFLQQRQIRTFPFWPQLLQSYLLLHGYSSINAHH